MKTKTTSADMRTTHRVLSYAQQAYVSSGVWIGSTDYADCLRALSSSAVASVDGVEDARRASSAAAAANICELKSYPTSAAAAQGLARSVGTYGRVASRSGDILSAVSTLAHASETMSGVKWWWGKGGPKERGGRERERGGESRARALLNREVAALWAEGPEGRLPTWSRKWETDREESKRRMHDDLEGGKLRWEEEEAERRRSWWVPTHTLGVPSP